MSPAGGVGQSTPTGWSPGGVHAGAQNLPTGRRVRVAESNRKPGDCAVPAAGQAVASTLGMRMARAAVGLLVSVHAVWALRRGAAAMRVVHGVVLGCALRAAVGARAARAAAAAHLSDLPAHCSAGAGAVAG